jgi:hypothetical protein
VPPLLSKSKYLTGLQCAKYLWTQIHEPERIPEADAITQYIFDQGHVVGEYAKKLFPGGIDIQHDDFMDNIVTTKKLVAERKPLFETGILSGRIYCRVDILNPVNEVSTFRIPGTPYQSGLLQIRYCAAGYVLGVMLQPPAHFEVPLYVCDYWLHRDTLERFGGRGSYELFY